MGDVVDVTPNNPLPQIPVNFKVWLLSNIQQTDRLLPRSTLDPSLSSLVLRGRFLGMRLSHSCFIARSIKSEESRVCETLWEQG